MNYGLYLSASGVLANMYRQDVFANNLANVQTTGFKPDIAGVRQRHPESIEGGFGFDLRKDLLDKIGGGVFAGPQYINFAGIRLEKTDMPLDVALGRDHPDHFFAVSVTDPKTQQRGIYLTRDGRFTRNADGFLVTTTGGHQVLDPEDAPIRIDPTRPLTIDRSGRLRQDGPPVARIQVSSVDTGALRKTGENLFKIDGPDRRRVVTDPRVLPGFLEASGTDPIKALMNLIDATKAVTANGNLIRYHDALLDHAVNVLGRVVA